MTWWTGVRKFAAFSRRKQLLLLEALVMLAWARLLKLLPFSGALRLLGTGREETPTAPVEADKAALKQVGGALLIAGRRTPWDSNCLVMAMAGMSMLARRGIASTMYLGTARDSRTGRMIAHAWLRSGPYCVTGAEELEKYTVVAAFGKRMAYKAERRSVSHG